MRTVSTYHQLFLPPNSCLFSYLRSHNAALLALRCAALHAAPRTQCTDINSCPAAVSHPSGAAQGRLFGWRMILIGLSGAIMIGLSLKVLVH